MSCSRRSAPTMGCRSVSGRATRSASRPACRSTATSSTSTRTPTRRASDASSSSTKPGDFVGRAALEKVARDGPARRLVGLIVEGRGIARHGYPVWSGERRTGVVTSGTQSPTLGRPDRDGLRRAGRRGAGYRCRCRDPRRPRPGAGRRPAVLQEESLSPMVPTDLRYTKDHEWVRIDGDEATIGITAYAADQLGDIVFVELPGARPDARAVRGLRRGRVGQGRQRPVRADQRRGQRDERGPRRRAPSSSTATRSVAAG